MNAQSASYTSTRSTNTAPTDVHQGTSKAVVSFDVPGVDYGDILLFSRGQELTLEATLWLTSDSTRELLSVVRLPDEYDVSACSSVLRAGRLTVTIPRATPKVRIIDVDLVL